MLHVVDASVVLSVARGDVSFIRQLMLTRKGELAVPEPVVVHTGIEVRGLPQFEAFERWTRFVETIPRTIWDAEVTEALLDLEPPAGLAVNLDIVTAAHAVAKKASIYTREPERYAWLRRTRVVAA